MISPRVLERRESGLYSCDLFLT
uniref:Uncharacterized protein n=1 Tax=Solanum lycopersicum TaxID=4081 RepID=K4DC94_SOLLC